jgi:hypothetical protein
VTTYVKTVDMWEKTAATFNASDPASKWMDLSDTAIAGATKRTRVEFTTTAPADMNGWVAIEGGKFVEDNLSDFFGGWKNNGNSISLSMADVALQDRKDSMVRLDASYIPAIGAEYTLEIVSKLDVTADTDNTINTFGANFNYEGEENRVIALNIGDMRQFWAVDSTLYPYASAMKSTNYFEYKLNGTSYTRSNVAVSLSDSTDYVGQIHTITYDKIKDGDKFDVRQTLVYGSTVKTALAYNDITITAASDTKDFYLLNNVPNETYAIRLYNRVLKD